MISQSGRLSVDYPYTMRFESSPRGIQTFPRISKSTHDALELLVLVHKERGDILPLCEHPRCN